MMPINKIKENKKTILVVDDEIDILKSIEFTLKHEGYDVLLATDGHEALNLVNKNYPDLLILDLMLPKMNGFDVCKKLREEGNRIPILMLTARSNEIDTVIGLEMGADDYIAKPARLKELVARVKTHLRISESSKTLTTQENNEGIKKDEIEEFQLGNLKMNFRNYTVIYKGQSLYLTQREFELLKKLALSPNRVFQRDQLLEEVWGWSFIGESRTVDVHIRYLREKLEDDPANPKIIKTVRGIGYKLVIDK